MTRRTLIRSSIILAPVAAAFVLAQFAPWDAAGLRALDFLERPLARAAVAATTWGDTLARVVRDPGRAAALERELSALRTEHALLQRASLEREQEAASRAHAYAASLGTPVHGRILAAAFEPTVQSVVIAIPSDAGVRAGNPVVVRGALIGVVHTRSVSRAVVRLLTDPRLRIGVERTDASETLGILESDSGGGLVVTHIPGDRAAAVGATVVTGATASGIPRGIPIGTIVDQRTDPDGFFQSAIIHPIADPRRELIATVLMQPSETLP